MTGGMKKERGRPRAQGLRLRSALGSGRLGRADTKNLTQRRKGAKAQRAQRCDYCAVIPDFLTVIPAKAGIQRVGNVVYAPHVPLDFGFRRPRTLMSTRAGSRACGRGRPRSQRGGESQARQAKPSLIPPSLCAFALIFPAKPHHHAQGGVVAAGIAVGVMVCSVTLMPSHLSLG